MDQDTQANQPSRRQFLVAGLGMAALAGCGTTTSLVIEPRPRTDWPEPVDHPRPSYDRKIVRNTDPTPPRPPARPATPTRRSNLSFDPIPRSRWAQAAPMPHRLNRLGSVQRITIHHEGWEPVDFTDTATTADRLELIRKSHLQRMTAGDIGYHFIIDRAGNAWEGRPLQYQGAHVKNHNENNLGIMVLGNFDVQAPSVVQTQALETALNHLMKQYRVPAQYVYTHQELNPTRCPGVQLQSRIVAMRNARRIG